MIRKHITLLLALVLSIVLAKAVGYTAPRSSPQEGQTLQPVAVHTEVPEGTPIEIENVQATPAPLGSRGIRYEIANTGTSRLLAIEIKWSLKFARGTSNQVVARKDYFFNPTALAPGATDQFMI
ncbi:MAG TPA: hypothetical protein VKW70_04280 [Terriglobia bacterium]|nr:hypothetical protein [Terriglobia bacterium]